MKARTRRKLEMGDKALLFSRANPDSSPGYGVALSQLENQVMRADLLATQQFEGIRLVRASTARKAELRGMLTRTQLAYLDRLGKIAAKEVPELERTLALSPAASTFHAFRTAARSLVAEAQSHREVLLRYGLVESVLDEAGQALDQFDIALQQGADARRAHVGASSELEAVAEEIGQVVRVMDALNRYRFRDDGERLAAWASASSVVAAPRATTEPDGTSPEGELKPAA